MPQTSERTKENQQFSRAGTTDAADADKLVDVIGGELVENKAEDITVLDVHELTTLTDRFIVCHVATDVQVKAIVNKVIQATKEALQEKPWQEEGLRANRWVILDYVNVVVHVFKREVREHYGLEQIWGDANISKIKDPKG